MKCKISCSIGELIDKITILKIKNFKAVGEVQRENIQKELNLLTEENPVTNSDEPLFVELSKINEKLWELEDLIREKSRRKCFDKSFIDCAIQIHSTNDERYNTKRKINDKYGSFLKEEKIYRTVLAQNNIIESKKVQMLAVAKSYYQNREFDKALPIFGSLMQNIEDYPKYDIFTIELLFSFDTMCSVFNIQFKYYNKIDDIMRQINTLPDISITFKKWCKRQYSLNCLRNLRYKQCYDYLCEINSLENARVNPDTVDFFKEDDKNKVLLVYDAGGIGDKIMLSRFIPELCEKYRDNTILFLLPNNLLWLYETTFNYIPNLEITTPEIMENKDFDYHCNLMSLLKFMSYEYDLITFKPLFLNLQANISPLCREIVTQIKSNNRKSFILNWRGSPICDIQHNRMMDIQNVLYLCEKTQDVDWIIIAQNLNQDEMSLKNYDNVQIYSDQIDLARAFEDSVTIIRNVDAVFSTDTSIVHLSENLGIKTYVLLSVGCEWRWSRNTNTNWYPDAILLRQDRIGDWENVINSIIEISKTYKNDYISR
tara:strand:- start:3757 stop:5382 length:1626 start_codon:yes stop_codon:yes gene_type:complete